MRRIAFILFLLIAVGAAGGATWWFNYRKPPWNELALYGNVDLRQVELPFNDNERIAAVNVQEGDHVKRGQILAELDTGRLVPQVNQGRRKSPLNGKSSRDCTTAADPRRLHKPGRMSPRRRLTRTMPTGNMTASKNSLSNRADRP